MTSDRKEKKANRLIHAASPYLLQHAYNPVDWFEWGPEALDKASKENKPILVSIGYSACHWCHVMERESFEKDDIAQIMNAHFVCIKVDREERPTSTRCTWRRFKPWAGTEDGRSKFFSTPRNNPFIGA